MASDGPLLGAGWQDQLTMGQFNRRGRVTTIPFNEITGSHNLASRAFCYSGMNEHVNSRPFLPLARHSSWLLPAIM